MCCALLRVVWCLTLVVDCYRCLLLSVVVIVSRCVLLFVVLSVVCSLVSSCMLVACVCWICFCAVCCLPFCALVCIAILIICVCPLLLVVARCLDNTYVLLSVAYYWCALCIVGCSSVALVVVRWYCLLMAVCW